MEPNLPSAVKWRTAPAILLIVEGSIHLAIALLVYGTILAHASCGPRNLDLTSWEGIGLIGMAVAALASPVWGIYTLVAGIALLKNLHFARVMTLIAGIVLMAVNVIYLGGSIFSGDHQRLGLPTLAFLTTVYLARISLGGYWFLAGVKR